MSSPSQVENFKKADPEYGQRIEDLLEKYKSVRHVCNMWCYSIIAFVQLMWSLFNEQKIGPRLNFKLTSDVCVSYYISVVVVFCLNVAFYQKSIAV